MKTKWLFFLAIVLGCGSKTETNLSEQDSLAVDSSARTELVIAPQATTAYTPVIHNFIGFIANTLTEDDREAKVWESLEPLLVAFDTTTFHTLTKSSTMPGTYETPEETLSSIETVTITLYYNDAHELRAIKREYNYEVGGPDRYDRSFELYIFDGNVFAVYEDKGTSLDMAVQNHKRGVTKLCPDCGVYLSAGVSSNDAIVSGDMDADALAQLETSAHGYESVVLEYAGYDKYAAVGADYVYQTVEPLSEDTDYEVLYTASKSYYEKFMKPKVNR